MEADDGAPQSGRAVVVRELAARDSSSRELEIWVSDTGTGIPADDHERIFERFGKGSNSAVSEGSGLGLSIVKAIAEAHGGTVLLESEEGKGSRFVLRIPSGEDASGTSEDSAAADTAGRSGPEGTAAKGGARHRGPVTWDPDTREPGPKGWRPKKPGAAGRKPKPAGPASSIDLAARAGGMA